MTKSPRWLTHFESYDGQREITGPRHNPVIIELIDRADGKDDGKQLQGIHDDEIPYCSSALCGVMEEIGIVSPRTAWARSWLKWGQTLIGPALGAIVIFERGSGGHVGVVAGRTANNLVVFGANQSNMFRHSEFSRTRVLGYRWPANEPMPGNISFASLPIVKSDGTLSRNET